MTPEQVTGNIKVKSIDARKIIDVNNVDNMVCSLGDNVPAYENTDFIATVTIFDDWYARSIEGLNINFDNGEPLEPDQYVWTAVDKTKTATLFIPAQYMVGSKLNFATGTSVGVYHDVSYYEEGQDELFEIENKTLWEGENYVTQITKKSDKALLTDKESVKLYVTGFDIPMDSNFYEWEPMQGTDNYLLTLYSTMTEKGISIQLIFN